MKCTKMYTREPCNTANLSSWKQHITDWSIMNHSSGKPYIAMIKMY